MITVILHAPGKLMVRRLRCTAMAIILLLLVGVRTCGEEGPPEVAKWQQGGACRVACSPSTKLMVTGAQDGELAFWTLGAEGRKASVATEERKFSAIQFAPDGRTLATIGVFPRLSIFDAKSFDKTRVVPLENFALSMVFLAEKDQVAVGHYPPTGTYGESQRGAIVIYDVSNSKKVASVSGRWDYPRAIAASPNGKLLAVGADNGLLSFVDLGRRATAKEVKASDCEIALATFSPDGSHLASADQAGRITTWNPINGQRELQWTAYGGFLPCVLAYQSDTVIASVSSRGPIRFWDARHGALIREIDTKPSRILRTAAYWPRWKCFALVYYYGGEIQIIDATERLAGEGVQVRPIADMGSGRD